MFKNDQKLFYGLVCVFSSLYINCAKADETFSKDFFDLELFSLSKHTEDAFDAPAAVFIITAEDIRRSGATALPDVLRMAPGVQVSEQNAHTWAVSERGFATQFTNKILIMIDGRVVYKPLFSGSFWDMLDMPLENIDRIEVIRGPGGTIWGSNAVNGVINIITKKASATKGNQLTLQVSSTGEKTIDVAHSNITPDGDSYRLFARRSEHASDYTIGGDPADDGWTASNVGFRYDTKQYDKDNLTVQGEFKNNIANSYFTTFPTLTPPYTLSDPLSQFQQNANVVTKWDHTLDNNSHLQSQFYFDYDRLRTNVVDWNGYTFDGDIQHVWQMNPINEITSGVGLRYSIDQQNNITNPWIQYSNLMRNDSLYSAFLQDKIRLVPNKMFLTLGSKFEHNDFSGFEYQPSARVTYYPDDNQTVWASVTRAVRTPSIGETDATVRLLGTPTGYVARNFEDGYTSEELVAYEVGYRTIPYDQLLFEGTLFYNDYTKLRTLEAEPAFGNIILPNGTQNNGYGETYGAEVDSKFQVRKDWRLQASYTFMEMALHLEPGAVDPTFAPQEQQTPQQQFSVNSFYNILPNVEFDNNIYYVGKVIGFTTAQPIKAYTRLDSRLSWHVQENVEVSLIGQNLLDDRHQEFQPALYSLPEKVGRSAFAKLAVNF